MDNAERTKRRLQKKLEARNKAKEEQQQKSLSEKETVEIRKQENEKKEDLAAKIESQIADIENDDKRAKKKKKRKKKKNKSLENATDEAKTSSPASSKETKPDVEKPTMQDVLDNLKAHEKNAAELQRKGVWAPGAGSTSSGLANGVHAEADEASDLSPQEQAKMQALLGNAKAANTRSFVGKKGVTAEIEPKDVDRKATLVFQGCSDCTYTLNALCTKVYIQHCDSFTLNINRKVVTQTLEVYKSKDVDVDINVKIKTLQIDMCDNFSVRFASKDCFDNIIWAGTESLSLRFGNCDDTLETGYSQMLKQNANYNKERSQFKIQFIRDKLSNEDLIRLDNGFPTTKIERNEFERRQEQQLQEMAERMGITIGKKKRRYTQSRT